MVNFKAVGKRNPQNITADAKYYAVAVQKERVELPHLVTNISNRCTVTGPDTYAVVLALLDEVKKELQAGHKVVLGNLGSFAISLSSTGAVESQSLNKNNIIKAKINYSPSRELKSMLKILNYNKVE